MRWRNSVEKKHQQLAQWAGNSDVTSGVFRPWFQKCPSGWWFGTFFHILGIIIPTVQLTNIVQRGLKILWHTFFTQRSSHWIRPDWSDGDNRGI